MQDVIEYRSTAFVWLLVSFINPLLYLFFWKGAISNSHPSGFTSLESVFSYYFLYLILGGFLLTHIDHEVAYWDIKEGGLIRYILKPFPYITSKFIMELTWRVMMGGLALIATLVLTFFFGHLFSISLTPLQIGFVVVACVLGLMISFLFKMIVGLSALWIVDFGGVEQLVFVITILFSGFVVPLDMFPSFLRVLASYIPIPYMVYYPIRLVQGLYTIDQSILIIATQVAWLLALFLCYNVVWKRGVKRFTGVGL